jgi:hypothetical protein
MWIPIYTIIGICIYIYISYYQYDVQKSINIVYNIIYIGINSSTILRFLYSAYEMLIFHDVVHVYLLQQPT